MRLEASFTKIYNLEAENKKLIEDKRNKQVKKNTNEEVLSDITNEHLVEPNIPNASFLKDLETKLNMK